MIGITKKGISPLISIVLIVMIAVSIGAAIMIVIQGITEEQLAATEAQQELIQCGTEVDVTVLEVNNGNRICINNSGSPTGGQVVVFFENTGQKDIQEWRVVAAGTQGIFTNQSTGDTLDAGDISGFRFGFENTGTVDSGAVESFRLSPRVSGGANNPLVSCEEPNLVFDQDVIESWVSCDSVSWDDSV